MSHRACLTLGERGLVRPCCAGHLHGPRRPRFAYDRRGASTRDLAPSKQGASTQAGRLHGRGVRWAGTLAGLGYSPKYTLICAWVSSGVPPLSMITTARGRPVVPSEEF